jgi:hypothetical protein
VVASLTTYSKRARSVDRALGRRRARRLTAKAAPPAAGALTDRAALPPPLATCPRCRARGKQVHTMLVTVQTEGETRVTAQCPGCRWRHTEAA